MDLRALPKVELHCHLEGCFRPSTVREVGRTLGLEVPDDPERFRRDWLITEPMANLEDALAKFVNIQKLWGSEEVIERMTYEACEYAHGQGIRLFELRYSPTFIADAHPNLDFERIHGAILRGLDRAGDIDVAVGLIGIVQKTLPERRARAVTDFIVECADAFVGIDLADQDIGFEVRRFAPLLERARAAGLHVTIHSGEDNGPEAPQHVRTAIDELGAERIGHGVNIVKDPATVEYVAASGVLLEVCPTSNWLTSTCATTREHPIRRLMEAGVAVSINSDDPGVFDIDLCHEYALLREEHGFTEAEFARCNDLAAAHSFLPAETKQRFWPRPVPE